MGLFAWRNLLTRPIRTLLALVGLSIPILGVLGLFCVSNGLRNLVGDTLSQIEGMLVLRENTLSPVISRVPATAVEDLRKLPGVRAVAPEVWGIPPAIDGRSMLITSLTRFSQKGVYSPFEQPIICGQDIQAHENLKSPVFSRALKQNGEGRFLRVEDKQQPNIVISRKIARLHPNADGKPKTVGDSLLIGTKPFKIVGVYETGSLILDVAIVMDIDSARAILNEPKDSISCVYLEGTDSANNAQLADLIEQTYHGLDARSMNEVETNFGALMSKIDIFLFMTVSLALVVGIVGIINTMLMSTSERFLEFGVLRTNGWSQGNILGLVTLESAYLGLVAGLVGSGLTWLGTVVANPFIGGGIHLGITPTMFGLGVVLAVVMGTVGGLYPAWRAARLLPMDAIRLGSH